ncbi:hypothetical protein COCOBI_15-0620 [Coccomyxa sp. Obi]|nr:hypothetical protein COCOBI_15-0620 [Coccomyxa sp. Obi]
MGLIFSLLRRLWSFILDVCAATLNDGDYEADEQIGGEGLMLTSTGPLAQNASSDNNSSDISSYSGSEDEMDIDACNWPPMERDTSNIPIDILAPIISSASQDVFEILRWRRTSRSFNDACMKVLQDKVETSLSNGPECDNILSSTVRPIVAKSPSSLKAAMRMCPSLQNIQWQRSRPFSENMSALMVSCCMHLTHLSLCCEVRLAALSVLGQSRSLQVLNLRSCRLTFNTPEAWQGFPQLRCLDLSYCTLVSSDNLRLIAPQLLSLSVHRCDQMEWPLCCHLSKCVCLDICNTSFGDRDLSALIEGAPDLRHLFIKKYYGSFWSSSESDRSERAVIELMRRRPYLGVRTLWGVPSALQSSEYERLGTEPSASSGEKAWMPHRRSL